VSSAIILAWEASRSGRWRRLALAHLVLRHKLTANDPFAEQADDSKLTDRLVGNLDVDLPLALEVLAL
jgi:acyl-CoA dehydrogenase